jgi:fatty-acyl-CoA synthase
MTAASRKRPPKLVGQKYSGILVGEWIDMTARRTPDLACFVTETETLTFAQVRDRVARLAAGLQRMGLEQGERVAVLSTDRPEYMEVAMAVLKLGGVLVPLNYRLQPAEIETLLRAAEATWIFAEERYVAPLLEMAPRLEYLDVIVGFDDTAETTPYGEISATGADGIYQAAFVADEDIIMLAFTSGTTGLPKGVMQSHRMWKTLLANSILEYRFLREEFRYTASPMYHVAGILLVFKMIVRGSTSLIIPQWDPARLLPWFRKGLTGVFLVPTMIAALLEQPDITPQDFTALRGVFYGAAPMTPTLLVRALEMFRCELFNGFGAGTEAGMQTILTPEDHLRALAGQTHLLGSVGRPGYNIDLQIWDENNNEVPTGTVGEIVTRSDMVMSGYYRQPDKTAEVIVNGWFKGGDLGYLDEHGYLYLAGRKNDMIIRGGENIYPIEIEETLAAYPGVLECAVVGTPDPFWGENVRAHLVFTTGHTATPEQIQNFCRERLAKYKVPDQITIHEHGLPKNASGKILRRVLREGA